MQVRRNSQTPSNLPLLTLSTNRCVRSGSLMLRGALLCNVVTPSTVPQNLRPVSLVARERRHLIHHNRCNLFIEPTSTAHHRDSRRSSIPRYLEENLGRLSSLFFSQVNVPSYPPKWSASFGTSPGRPLRGFPRWSSFGIIRSSRHLKDAPGPIRISSKICP